jgi:hypothetical protein
MGLFTLYRIRYGKNVSRETFSGTFSCNQWVRKSALCLAPESRRNPVLQAAACYFPRFQKLWLIKNRFLQGAACARAKLPLAVLKS